MGTTDFVTYQAGSNLHACFCAAKDAASAEHGHQQGSSGDIQTKTRVILRHDAPMTRAVADTFVYGTGAADVDDGDLERATRDGPAFALPICDAAAMPIGSLFYGQAPS